MNYERHLLKQLRRRTNSVEGVNGAALAVQTGGGDRNFKLSQGAYQPPFTAQVQFNLQILYFTESSGVYTQILPAALDATLKTKLPFFLFGQADFQAGYSVLQQNFPVSVWNYGDPFVYGKDVARTEFSELDATVKALLQKGDVVQPFTAVVTGPTNTVALVVMRCTDVPYATLLESTSSNLFKINMVRITLADSQATNLAQLRNPINVGTETMFGRFTKDTINPNSFKNPEQNQANIVDVLARIDIYKEKAIAQYINYDVAPFEWNIFIDDVVRQ